MTLNQYIGDSAAHAIPLRWARADFQPGEDWNLIWTVKADAEADADADALIQKASGLGITVAGAVATVATVPADTTSLAPVTLEWDLQAQHLETGEVRTVAAGDLRLARDATRLTTTSIPIHTTLPPYPGGGDVATAIHAAAAKAPPDDADELPLVDSGDTFALKKLTWATIKAALATYFGGVFAAVAHSHAFSAITAKPTTRGGYGLTDAAANGANSDITRLTGLTAGTLIISWGDADSGLYANDSKSIGYRYDGVEKFRFDANGFVIASPGGAANRTLAVYDGSTTFTAGLSAANTQCFGFGDLLGGSLGRFERSATTGLIRFPMQAGVAGASLSFDIGDPAASVRVRAAASQTAAIQEWRHSSETVVASVSAAGDGSFKGLTTAGPVTLAPAGASDPLAFNHNVYTYGSGSASAAHLIALGAGATGVELFQAATAEAARSTLGTIRRVATTDYTSSSTTLTSAPELTFPVESGKTYRVDLALVVSSLSAVGGVQVTMSYPAISRTGFGWSQTQLHQTAKFPNLGSSSVNLNTNTTGVPNGTTGLSGWVHLRPTSSGDVTFEAGQFSAGTGTVGILAGSIITVTEL